MLDKLHIIDIFITNPKVKKPKIPKIKKSPLKKFPSKKLIFFMGTKTNFRVERKARAWLARVVKVKGELRVGGG
jgi:hypothetical protein